MCENFLSLRIARIAEWIFWAGFLKILCGQDLYNANCAQKLINSIVNNAYLC